MSPDQITPEIPAILLEAAAKEVKPPREG